MNFVAEGKTFDIERVKDQFFRISERGKGFTVSVDQDDKLRQWIIMVVTDVVRRNQRSGFVGRTRSGSWI